MKTVNQAGLARSAVLVFASIAAGCGPEMDGQRGTELEHRAGTPQTITLRGTIRDFKFSHPDFESYIGSDRGIIADRLGSDGKPVYAGSRTPTTSGKANFDQWYRDVPGVNASSSYPIELERVSEDPPLYRYRNSSFFPIDGQFFGNEGKPHNYAFTYEMHTVFKYEGGERFSFTGDDDVFVYINKHLVIDLGGVHEEQHATVYLDDVASRAGLEIGGIYQFDLFFAERHTTQSNFKVETSIATFSDCHPGYSSGMVGLDYVEVSGNPTVKGSFPSLFSNNAIDLAGNFEIDGDVISGGSVSITGGNRPTGTVVENAGKVQVPDPTDAVTTAKGKNDNAKVCLGPKRRGTCSGDTLGTSLTLSGQESLTLPAGDYYFDSISINGKAKLNVDGMVTIYLNGPATFNGGSATNPSFDALSIVSSSDAEIKFNGGGSTVTHVYAPHATVRFAGSQGFKGGALAKDLRINGTADLEVTGDVLTSLGGMCDAADFEELGGASGSGGYVPPGLPELPH